MMKIHKTLRWHRKKLLTRFSSRRTSSERLYRQTRTVHHFVHEFLLPVFRSLQGDVHKQVTIIMLFVPRSLLANTHRHETDKKGNNLSSTEIFIGGRREEKNVKIEKDFNRERENVVAEFRTLLQCREAE